MFTNKMINNYTYATRYIVSWIKMGGKLRYLDDVDKFYKWLLSTGMSEEEADHIKFLATNGKLELENSVNAFLNEHH